MRIQIDNEVFEVEGDQNLLKACLSLGFDLPYFCWHPVLDSIGACRQCAVKLFKDEQDARGRIVMACMTPVSDGVRISIDDPEVRAFRAGVIEWLMLNHPHDCPVCDEGGECHLQDMTVMTGHVSRRYRGAKRTFRNQDLGPFVNHEMNRCIQCYRCVRFYRDHAGGRDLGAFSLRNQVYFGRHEDGVLGSAFSGNLAEICPTGVFTDKTFKSHYVRKWDLASAPSLCVHCGLGCNTIAAEHGGSVRRIRNRFNGEVNGYFLCDRGRFGYRFLDSGERLRRPLLRASKNQAPVAASAEDALERAREILAGSRGVVGIGSPRASLETNFTLRQLVGAGSFSSGMSEADFQLAGAAASILRDGPVRSASLEEAGRADAVLVLGEDVSNYAPLLDLALRRSVRRRPVRDLDGSGIPAWDDHAVRNAIGDQKGPLFIATPAATGIDDIATHTWRAAPDDIARLGYSVASHIDGGVPAPSGLDAEGRNIALQAARALAEAEHPLVVSGAGLGSLAVLEAAANVAWALKQKADRPAALFLALPEANSMGLALMDCVSLGAVMDTVESGAADTVVVAENDLFRRAEPWLVERLLEAENVIVLDCLMSETVASADVALPAAAFSESEGTLVSSEGRAQRFFQVTPPGGDVRESWRWLGGMAPGDREGPHWQTLDGVYATLASELPLFETVRDAAPGAEFRILGRKVARQTFRHSSRTAATADLDVNEAVPPEDPGSPFSFSMEGFQGHPPPPLIPRYWSPGWNSVQALNKYQSETGGPLLGGEPGVRLIEPGRQPVNYFERYPEPFAARAGAWLVVPLYHVFGSEELSALSPGIEQLKPDAYVGLNPGDAASLGISEGDQVKLELEGGAHRFLPARILGRLPAGTVGLPVCLPGLEGMVQPGIRVLILPAESE